MGKLGKRQIRKKEPDEDQMREIDGIGKPGDIRQPEHLRRRDP